ncbi:MAG: 50S ribosomal protein L21 [Mollicutes bacterium]|nr:MAG: 50S ribosomal protein L21 [Mollicutes bacterium]
MINKIKLPTTYEQIMKITPDANMKNEMTVKNKIQPKSTEKKSEFAVIVYRNQQYKVSEGDRVYFPLIADSEEKQTIIFDQVILTQNQVGTPFLKDLIVEGEVLNPLKKAKKVIVFKYKSKKNYRIKTGYRNKLTLIQIKAIKKKSSAKISVKKKDDEKLNNT